MKTLKTTLKAWPTVFLIAVTLSCLTQGVAKLLGIELPEQASLEWVKAARGWAFVKICLFVLVGAPVGEELLFRFLLFKGPLWLAGKMRRLRPSLAIEESPALVAVVSSVLFVAAHYGRANPFPDNAFVALFFFGLAQCWLYRRTGRLWSPVLNHALFNLTNLVGLFVIPQ